MVPVAPRLPLILLLFTAACIMVGGIVLARDEQLSRVPQDREPLLKFATSLQKELLRLEQMHEGHLENLSRRILMADTLRTQQECAGITGIVECSLLPRTKGPPEEYVRMSGIPYGAYPRPTFDAPSIERSDFRVLDRAVFTDSSTAMQGWLEEPGWPLMYWSQRPKSYVLFFTIEPKEVQQAMNTWVVAWLQDHPTYQSLLDGRVELLGPQGERLAMTTGASGRTGQAHWSQVLPTRYGSWQVQNWDRVETAVIYHNSTLTIAAALSMLVALLGILVHAQQRRSHQLATQRVSFVNRVSHELRTPLTNMLLNLDIIEDSLPHEGRAASRLALVREEAGRLARLIANVLTFSRSEQGALKLQTVDCRPAHVVDGVIEQFSASFARHGITVVREDAVDDTLCALDPDALSQVTANLLSNVEKYAPGAPVRISTAREGSSLVLRVSDGGPGIARAEVERIFQPFVRLDDRVAAGVTGTGLGLSIARELAERMGGTLVLRHAGDDGSLKGACFVLSVPVSDVFGTSRPEAPPAATVSSASL